MLYRAVPVRADAEIEAPEGKPFIQRPIAGCDPTELTGGTSSSCGFSDSLTVTCWAIQTFLSLSDYSDPGANVQFPTLQHV